MNQVKFSSISLSKELMQAIDDIGYDNATLIQSQSIPLILEGHDVIGRSQTGSGKTAAFGLPAIDMIDESLPAKKVQVIILCPTRELAVQASNEINKFAKYKSRVKSIAIYGGEPIGLQMARLRQGGQIIVGTPGRIMDHMRRKTLKLDDVKMVVLDEADEMLNMGFVEDIETILAEVPSERQTILFSATMPSQVLAITKRFQNNPKMVEIKQEQKTVSTTEQYFFNVPMGKKTQALRRLLEYYKPSSAIIFCNTKKMVDELIVDLKKFGFKAQGLHGDMRQSARTQVMNQFKSGQVDMLVATDVAARGIDVNDVKIVINYDLPIEYEYYVHRIGRTGRAGKAGQAFTLIQGGAQFALLRNIMRYTKCEIKQKALPTIKAIRDMQISELSYNILAFMDENDVSQYLGAVNMIAYEGHSEEKIAAALIAMTLKQNDTQDDISDSFKEFDLKSEPAKNNRNAKKPQNKIRTNFKRAEYNDANMASVRISIGRKDKISVNHILGAVAGESGLPGKLFGAIDIHDNYSTIDVPKELKKTVVQKLNKSKIKGKSVTVV